MLRVISSKSDWINGKSSNPLWVWETNNKDDVEGCKLDFEG